MSSLLLLLSSSPFIGVTVRPPFPQSSDGFSPHHQTPFAAIRRNLTINSVISFTGKPLIYHYSSTTVPSGFNFALHPLSIFSNLPYKENPSFGLTLMKPTHPEPPWTMISSTIVEDTIPILEPFVNSWGIIDTPPDMKKLIVADIPLPEYILDQFCLYISLLFLFLSAHCHLQHNFLIYLCIYINLSLSVYPQIFTPVPKMDDLSNTFNATLNLTALKTQIYALTEAPDHPEDDGRKEPSAFLAVKLLTTHHFNSEAFKNRLKQMWPERFSINVLEKEPNFYTVEFGCFGDRRRVLIGQPWHFDYKLIVMTPLEAGSVVTAEALTTTPFWIQVSGIPFLKRSRALAQRLGEVLGRFIEVDLASLNETWGQYLEFRLKWM
uniref:DUF4283 domain-containing protein n=1 Tax=Cannabis sativa TaxID=3483 RepID=A0A803Q330_CANSA